jgi:hypothetical protein
MSKKMLNEQLLAPVIARGDSPRDRVARHMKEAVAAGATFVLVAGCPFCGNDPIPSPAQCRMLKAADLVDATAATVSAPPAPLQISVELSTRYEGTGIEIEFDAGPPVVRGGTLVSNDAGYRFLVAPTDGGTVFDLVFRATCSDYGRSPSSLGVKVTVDCADAGNPSAVVTQVDGG